MMEMMQEKVFFTSVQLMMSKKLKWMHKHPFRTFWLRNIVLLLYNIKVCVRRFWIIFKTYAGSFCIFVIVQAVARDLFAERKILNLFHLNVLSNPISNSATVFRNKLVIPTLSIHKFLHIKLLYTTIFINDTHRERLMFH